MQYEVLTQGARGTLVVKPSPTDTCWLNFKATTIDATEFDSNSKRKKPAEIKPAEVVAGWGQAILTMREGDKWLVTVPSELGYGDVGRGAVIPPGSVLVYEVELVKVVKDRSISQSNLLVYFLCTGFALIVMKAVGIIDNMQDNYYRLADPVSLEGAEGNKYVWMDIEIDGVAAGRIEYELFYPFLPKTCENFRALCTGEKGVGQAGKPLCYKGSSFHRIITNFMCQGGDIVNNNGTGSDSIYGGTFEDECVNGWVKHSKGGLLSMANAGKNMNGSQFFITILSVRWLDTKHVVFGRIVNGMNVVDKMEEGTANREDGALPIVIVIKDCGETIKKDKKTS